jgi:hypothetical protein
MSMRHLSEKLQVPDLFHVLDLSQENILIECPVMIPVRHFTVITDVYGSVPPNPAWAGLAGYPGATPGPVEMEDW